MNHMNGVILLQRWAWAVTFILISKYIIHNIYFCCMQACSTMNKLEHKEFWGSLDVISLSQNQPFKNTNARVLHQKSWMNPLIRVRLAHAAYFQNVTQEGFFGLEFLNFIFLFFLYFKVHLFKSFFFFFWLWQKT